MSIGLPEPCLRWGHTGLRGSQKDHVLIGTLMSQIKSRVTGERPKSERLYGEWEQSRSLAKEFEGRRRRTGRPERGLEQPDGERTGRYRPRGCRAVDALFLGLGENTPINKASKNSTRRSRNRFTFAQLLTEATLNLCGAGRVLEP